MEEKDRYEEFKVVSNFWGWVILISFAATILISGMIFHMSIKEVPREWDFGALPDTPAKSIYSTREPRETNSVQLQITPLPEGVPGQDTLRGKQSFMKEKDLGNHR
jgi:hypothetical protein